MAEYDKAVPPGGEGKITLRVSTKGYQGNIWKGAKVYTNDPINNVATLRVKAFVKASIHLSSQYVYLVGSENQSITEVVEIRAELDKPLKLNPIQFDLAQKLTYTLEEMEKGRRFQIRFTTIPGPCGIYKGFLKLKTNYQERPEITIWIRGRVREK